MEEHLEISAGIIISAQIPSKLVLAKFDPFFDKMKISIVIPLYNKEKSILRAINSVLNQSEQDFELIVVNDGSTDQSAALVAAKISDNKKIRLFDQENSGASAARNRGVAEAQSDLIAFLDADDEWLPDFIKTILDLRAQFPEGNVFGTLYFFQDQIGRKFLPKTAALFENDARCVLKDFLKFLRIGLPFNSSSFAVSKTAFREIGGFPVGIKYREDVDLWIRLSLKHKIVYCNKPLAIYHQEAENRACELFDYIIDEHYPAKNLARLLRNKEIPEHLKQSAIEYVAKYYLAHARYCLYHGNADKAREYLRVCSGTKIYLINWGLLYVCACIPPLFLHSLIRMKNKIQGTAS
jgi:glycosyltransferase involved in cell wall biosynthesis